MSGTFPLASGESNLERRHPHIIRRLRQLWGQPEGSSYLAELMVDSRGGRAGFSNEVFAELFTLAREVPPLPARPVPGAPHPGGGGAAGADRLQ